MVDDGQVRVSGSCEEGGAGEHEQEQEDEDEDEDEGRSWSRAVSSLPKKRDSGGRAGGRSSSMLRIHEGPGSLGSCLALLRFLALPFLAAPPLFPNQHQLGPSTMAV